jgi:hypothetical protein
VGAPVLWASLARARLELGQPDEARTAAEEAVAISQAHAMDRIGILPLVVLARVLMATEGFDAADAIEAHFQDALVLSRRTESLLEEPGIHVGLAKLARLRGDEATAEREAKEAQRVLVELGAPAKPPQVRSESR